MKDLEKINSLDDTKNTLEKNTQSLEITSKLARLNLDMDLLGNYNSLSSWVGEFGDLSKLKTALKDNKNSMIITEEGSKKGLGWVPGEVIKINDEKINVPHMGWNSVKVKRINSLIKSIDHKFRFYFIHSYIVKLQDKKNEILETEYGKKFTSSFAYKNFYGVQFHPEKSHKYGMKILKNFTNI